MPQYKPSECSFDPILSPILKNPYLKSASTLLYVYIPLLLFWIGFILILFFLFEFHCKLLMPLPLESLVIILRTLTQLP